MPPFLGLARTRSFRQLHNYVGDLPRIPFRTPCEASQHLEYRTYRSLVFRQQVRRILTGATLPVGPNTSRLQCADLDSERRDFHRERVAEAANGPLGRVIRRISGTGDAATDRRDLKDVTAPLLAHHRDGGACRVHHAVKACVHDGLEVFRTHLLEWRKLSISG